MSHSGKARAWTLSGCAAIGLIALSASAQAEVLFDSLNSPNTGIMEGPPYLFDASFATGASTFYATDIALLLNQVGLVFPGDTFTVTLVGGFPLAEVKLIDGIGLNVGPGLDGPIVGSVTLPISDLSTDLKVEHFNQFASIPLKSNSFYWVDLNVSGPMTDEGPSLGWGTTDDGSGPGVLEGYNSSDFTDFGFFPNKPTPPPNSGGPPFQMEISGVAAVPEPSTWVMVLVGFVGLGYAGHRARRSALVA
jgi:PEP-CTERM motif